MLPRCQQGGLILHLLLQAGSAGDIRMISQRILRIVDSFCGLSVGFGTVTAVRISWTYERYVSWSGSAGSAGSAGVAGSVGYTVSVGSAGSAGSAGLNGSAGSAGPVRAAILHDACH